MFILRATCGTILLTIVQVVALAPREASGYFVLFVSTLLVNLIITRHFHRSIIRVVEEMITTVRLRMMEKIRRTDLRSLEKMGKTDIRTAVVSDIKAISDATFTFVRMGQALSGMTSALIYMATFSRDILLFTLGVLAGLGCLYALNQRVMVQALARIRDGEKGVFRSFHHLLYGFKELRLNDEKSDDFHHTELKRRTEQTKERRIENAYRFIRHFSLTFIIWNCAFAVVALGLPAMGHYSRDVVSKAIGVIFFLPLSTLLDAVPRVAEVRASFQELLRVERMLETLEQETPCPVSDGGTGTGGGTGGGGFRELRYEEVMFRYTDKHGVPTFAIGPLDLSVRAGEILFVSGGNGSGKSTLLKVMTGLYPPFSGTMLMNGREIGPSDLRRLFSAVFTDFHLFDRLYGLSHVREEQVNLFLRRMQLDHKTRFAGGKFSTIDLSTGQRKRLALIAALLEDRPICVFDEWAADQDPEFRDQYYHQMLPELKRQGKTVIAVTHDDRYFHTADRVVRLEYGEVFVSLMSLMSLMSL